MTIDLVIAWALRLWLALLFVAAAWHKLSDRPRFEAAIRAYELLPMRGATSASWLLPACEGAIALALLVPAWQRHAAGAAVALLLLYTAAITINLARGRRRIDCGCFPSRSATPISGALVARNGGLVAAACLLLLPVRTRPLLWIDALTLITTLVTLSLLWGATQRLVRTGPALRRLGGLR
jgi:uncharacterized membrane protein YphA (DoxX/SURF4 family)